MTPAFLKRMLVISMIFFGALQGFIVYQLSLIILKRLRFPVESPKPLVQYFPPKWVGYVALFFFAGYYYTTLKPLDNEFLQNFFQTLGTFALLFLFLFGTVAAYQAIRAWLVQNKIIAMLLTFFAVTSFTIVVIILGYLYISAGFHDLLLEKMAQNEKKQKNTPPPRAF